MLECLREVSLTTKPGEKVLYLVMVMVTYNLQTFSEVFLSYCLFAILSLQKRILRLNVTLSRKYIFISPSIIILSIWYANAKLFV